MRDRGGSSRCRILTLVAGVFGFFDHGFSTKACSRFFWVVPIFKLFLYLASQAILTIRTYAVSRKSPVILRLLVLLFLVCAAGQFISTFWKRIPFQQASNCTSGNEPGVKVASLYYAACLFFDAVTMAISAAYLWKFSSSSRNSIISNNVGRLTKMMLEDGIVYFVVLSAMNIVNLIFFQSRDTVLQSSADHDLQLAFHPQPLRTHSRGPLRGQHLSRANERPRGPARAIPYRHNGRGRRPHGSHRDQKCDHHDRHRARGPRGVVDECQGGAVGD
ncbi:hypothetical protein B0H16DRAFT_586844 [Mycena metata]|uniref:Uncharacterized protein n=1 Tax=Mycena metata TaxID=1033252 RepID=A0AAD7J968_9AGAR|nr:hypothetical protein B0H16DRAFT_586844 [Mycena metata]